MKKLVIYDSYFGNTATIAEKIANELNCDHIKVHAMKKEMINDYDLVVIGSPTRAFQATKEIKAVVKEIKRLDIQVAFFDTRVKMDDKVPRFLKFMASKFGYSNDTLEKIAGKKNIKLIVPSGEFYVQDSEGPLFEQEIDKAKQFADDILEKLT